VTFQAQYSGGCAECGTDVKGTEAYYNGHGEVLHVNCPDTPELSIDRSKVCPDCFTEHRGECL
jgi:hypothetical protein